VASLDHAEELEIVPMERRADGQLPESAEVDEPFVELVEIEDVVAVEIEQEQIVFS